MKVITRRLGQAVTLGDDITVTVREVGKDKCKLSVEAPPEVNVRRGELPRYCQGGCPSPKREDGVCGRPAVPVRVYGSDGHDWGDFNYCPHAIAVDTEKGMKVVVVDEGGEK